jgi:hypothetical protein
MLQCSPSEWLPLARGDTGSESIAHQKLGGSCTSDQRWKWSPPHGKPPASFSESDVGEFIRSTSPFDRMRRNRRSRSDDRLSRPPSVWRFGEPAHRLFGGSLGTECDVGRMLDELVSSELETTRLADDEVRHDCCLTMESTRFQLCQN